MPNRVHFVCRLLAGEELSKVVLGWKSFAVRRANEIPGLQLRETGGTQIVAGLTLPGPRPLAKVRGMDGASWDERKARG